MKRAILLSAGLLVLFAGLANFWIGHVTLGAALIAAFGGLVLISALVTRRERLAAGRDRRPPPEAIDASSMI
jgi:hypothetical protein